MDDLRVFCWVLDVENLWPSPSEPPETAKATAHWANGKDTQEALNLLTPAERTKVLRFYRPSDARLSLASCLLKRRAIVDTCGVAWPEVIVGEDNNRKPCYKHVESTDRALEFNVSHHGTLVALVGCPGDEVRLGVDVVRMNWERDYSRVLKDGFEAWANIYEMVFSDREVKDIAGFVPPEQLDFEEEIRAKLRHFYAHWCLKEAYVKMTGEALLASWLKELEFRNVQVPLPSSQLRQGAKATGEWGQKCSDVEVWFREQRVTDVKLEILAFQEDYMLAVACSSIRASVSPFKELDLKLDVCP